MKLLFSEAQADYAHYIFPYVIWAFPEPGETPADLFNAGFLPSSRNLDRFYLCRQVRVRLAKFQPSSENRRILRKGTGLQVELVPRAAFAYTPARREFCLRYAAAKFGPDVMPGERLDALFAAPLVTHLLVFRDAPAGREVGLATLYLEPPALAFYYYAFYDLAYAGRSLGMFMMTAAVKLLAESGLAHVHLGSCYSENARYKTQFAGAEFFNGFRWSDNPAELKYLLRRGQTPPLEHLLESAEYRETFYAGSLDAIRAASPFAVALRTEGRSR